MSSPMMKRMLGLACGCCAAAGVPATVMAADNASRPNQIFLSTLMVRSFNFDLRRAAVCAQQEPYASTRNHIRVVIWYDRTGATSDTLSSRGSAVSQGEMPVGHTG